MTRKDMVASLVHFCDNCDNCHICPGNEFCIGMAEECDAIGESVFCLLTDAEVYAMYLKCCAKRSEGVTMTTREIIKILINAKYGLHSVNLKKVRGEGNKMININFTSVCLKVDGVFLIKQALKKMHYRLDHKAAKRGYISRKWEAGICEYSGRFGEGYLLVYPRWDTTNYVYAEYWIKED